ncbi:50S ribosomal protein L15 [Luteimicrobium sp. NPDC057192]|jgi:large subunit ribosomal protein L15|uniref:50S ribosomal protein L15 n=1 Tax=Luteimicrobium sp. NPDC057192 TaxID=3346042 RepID=UPI0036344151
MAENKNDDVTPETAEAPKKPARKAPAKKATEAAAEAAPAKKAPARKPAAKKAETAAEAEAPKKPAAKATTKAAAKPEAEVGAGGTLKVHHLRPAPGAKTAKTRVGRGEASKGKTAGRGTKGTKARYQVPERFEGGQMPLHMRLPKLRGFKNPFRVEYQVVNLDKLASLYPEGGSVTVEDLVAKGAVRKGQLVKVLGTGELSVKLDVAVDALSGSAKDKILAAGGSVSED